MSIVGRTTQLCRNSTEREVRPRSFARLFRSKYRLGGNQRSPTGGFVAFVCNGNAVDEVDGISFSDGTPVVAADGT